MAAVTTFVRNSQQPGAGGYHRWVYRACERRGSILVVGLFAPLIGGLTDPRSPCRCPATLHCPLIPHRRHILNAQPGD